MLNASNLSKMNIVLTALLELLIQFSQHMVSMHVNSCVHLAIDCTLMQCKYIASNKSKRARKVPGRVPADPPTPVTHAVNFTNN